MNVTNLLVLVMLLLSITSAFAQADIAAISEPAIDMLPPIISGGSGVLQNQHYYRVIFDNEGEATVVAKIIFANTGMDDLTQVQLDIPGQSRLLSSVQEYQPWVEECVRYEEICEPCAIGDQRECELTCERTCAQTRRYKQWPPTYYALSADENTHADGAQYTFTLGQPIPTGEEAILLIAYKSESYTTQKLGSYSYDFETIRQNSDIGRVRVAIAVSEDLYLQGVDSGIEYKSFDESFATAARVPAPGAQSEALQEYSQSITYARGLVKTAEALDPNESFHVSGKYSESYLALHLAKIVGWGIGIIILIALFVGGVIKLTRKIEHKKQSPTSIAVLSSILSSVAIIGVFIAGWFGLSMLDNYYYYGSIGQALAVLVMIVWVVLLIALFIVPPILIGIKYGALYGALSAGITLGIVFILSIIGALVFALTSGAGVSPPVYY